MFRTDKATRRGLPQAREFSAFKDRVAAANAGLAMVLWASQTAIAKAFGLDDATPMDETLRR